MSQEDILATAQGVTGVLTILLASIAGISLVVGGIGIMNIMLVSVTERTREIGIRKALGARRRDILSQFLTEAIILSAVGGFLGWALGALLATIVSKLGLATSISASTVLLALGFSVAVGVFFGIYPAQKASRMDPIQALHFE
jgi:putative ABC transport system permease protein